MEHNKETEAVYTAQEDSHVVMSEKVQALAGSIYQEFERMINKYDESVVKELMPLVVNVLENLDLSYSENQEHEVEVELLREDNEQLVTQYEREKQLRKSSEQKLLEIEDQTEEEIKDLSGKKESLEAILRMLELKAKNSADHVTRLEEKESEMKREYAKLHERYTELFKTHMDYMERTKILMGTDRLENFGLAGMRKLSSNSVMTRSAGPVSFGFASLENNSMLKSFASPSDGHGGTFNLHSPSTMNIQEEMSMDEVMDVPDNLNEVQNGSKEKDPSAPTNMSQSQQGKSQNRKEERTGNTLYQEFSFQEPELAEEPSEITGSWVHPGEYASSDVGSEASCDSPTAKSSANNVNDNFFGMGKEVENLILENNELLETKNALNIVKDDLISKVDELTSEQEILREEIQSLRAVKSRMKLRIQELEEEIKKIREENEKKTNSKSDDEEDVPLAQRKRFTRVEMARVLMERNQYKERFMELQDAVRWTEMLRAAKHDPSLEKKNNKGFINFFSSLFGKTTPAPIGLTTDRLVSSGGVVSNSPTKIPGTAVPATSDYRSSVGRTEMSAEKLQLRRLGDPLQRKDQGAYKQIKAHVRKDDGRMQAYGWSLPAKSSGTPPAGMLYTAHGSKDSPSRSSPTASTLGTVTTMHGKHLPVPVPIYCRPFMEQTPGMKIFCASGVDLSGDYSRLEESCPTSPHVWICTATHSASRVTVIDANRPADILQTFDVCSSHLLCVVCVPGVKGDDFERDEGLDDSISSAESQELGAEERFGQLVYIQDDQSPHDDSKPKKLDATEEQKESLGTDKTEIEVKTDSLRKMDGTSDGVTEIQPKALQAQTSPSTSVNPNNVNAGEGGDTLRATIAASLIPPNTSISSVLPTVWLGAQSGFIYVHSAVSQWDKCLHKVKLLDSVLSIAPARGRTFVSMANGTVAIFRRQKDGQWDFNNYHVLNLGQQPHHSIRCLSVVRQDVWCGFRNKIHVLSILSLQVKTTFEAHPRKESQVRQMAWFGDGVWVSIRLDSTLRLYHAETHEHLQDVDIEPYVSKMLGTGKLGFSYARITALLMASHRLWIGTGNGVIISVPLQESTTILNAGSHGSRGPGSILRVAGDTPGKEIPYCSMSQAQLSFHGHRDAVKFFVSVPGSSGTIPPVAEAEYETDAVPMLRKSNSMLVISGGEGYIDFRVVDEGDGDTASHLIVWKLPLTFESQNSLLDSMVLPSLSPSRKTPSPGPSSDLSSSPILNPIASLINNHTPSPEQSLRHNGNGTEIV